MDLITLATARELCHEHWWASMWSSGWSPSMHDRRTILKWAAASSIRRSPGKKSQPPPPVTSTAAPVCARSSMRAHPGRISAGLSCPKFARPQEAANISWTYSSCSRRQTPGKLPAPNRAWYFGCRGCHGLGGRSMHGGHRSEEDLAVARYHWSQGRGRHVRRP